MRQLINLIQGKYKIIIIIGLLVLGITGGYLLVDKLDDGQNGIGVVQAQEGSDEEEEAPVRVIGAEADIRSLQETNSFNAVMQPGSEYAVMPKLEGELETVDVEVGDRVEKDQVLAEIDAEKYRYELEQAEAQLDAAEAEFDRLESGATDEELAQVEAQVQEARVSVEGAKAEVGFSEEIYDERTPDDMEIEQVENELEQAKVQLEMAEKEYRQAELAFEEADDNYQRMANLYEDGAISEQQYDEVKTGRDQAETQLEMAEDGLKQAELAVEGAEKMRDMTVDLYDFRVEEEQMVSQANTQYETAMAALDGAEAMLAETERGPTDEDLKAARAQVEQARVGLEMARSVYEDVEITAPADGFVAQVEMSAGEMAAPGNPLFYIVNLDEVKATANVSSQYVGLLETGDSAGVSVNGLPDEEFTGRISSVAPMSGEEGGFPVEVSVANSEYRIKAGMRGSIEFVIDEVSDAVVIPGDGIFDVEEDQAAVFVIEDGTARRQTVKTGMEDDNLVEITSGLAEGDQVVLYDQDRLVDGQAVEVVENESF
ncbi:MAG: efflux RND transporter periplasmic adaptor subunit [Bacillota bacterium]